jgi:hypothetical protein
MNPREKDLANFMRFATKSSTRRSRTSLVEPLEQRSLLSVALDVAIGSGGVKSVNYPSAGGATATIVLNNGGSATVHFVGDSITPTTKNNATTLTGANITVTGIDCTGTLTKSVLKATAKNNTGSFSLGRITTNGSFNDIVAPNAILTDGALISGSITDLNVQRIVGGPIAIGTGTAAVIRVANNASFDLTASAVKSISVGGNLTGSTITLARATQGSQTDLSSLAVKGTISTLRIDSRGSLGNISATALAASTIFSGVGNLALGQLLPTSSGDFSNINKINSIKLAKVSGNASFSNSYVSAYTLGSLKLGSVLVSNLGVPFGLSAHKYNSLNFTSGASGKTLNLNNVTSQTQVTNAVSKAGVDLQDFQITVAV